MPAETEAALASLYDGSPVGLLVCDTRLRVLRTNPALERLLRTPASTLRGSGIEQVPALLGRDGAAGAVAARVRAVLETGTPDLDTIVRYSPEAGPGLLWSISCFPLTDAAGRLLGAVCTLTDVTARERAREQFALRREAATRMGSATNAAGIAGELAQAAVPAVADLVLVDLLDTDPVGEEPPPDPTRDTVRLHLAAQHAATGIEPLTDLPIQAQVAPGTAEATCLADGRPLVVDDLEQAADWRAEHPQRATEALDRGTHTLLTVPLRAAGTALGLAHFYRRRSRGPYDSQDLALAEDLAADAALRLDSAASRAREAATSSVLQARMLRGGVFIPTRLAHTRLNLDGGVHHGDGANWCEAVPLSGARVALVVGDATGRGIQAIARAGRIRTIVRALAGLDLDPDELLTYLDRLARRALDAYRADGRPAGAIPTCLYAVYDRITGQCSVASAGLPAPVLARPGHPAERLNMPIGPPLGTGGPPYEMTSLCLPDDTVLAIHTTGLRCSQRVDATDDTHPFLATLARTDLPLEDLAGAAADAALASRPPDDDTSLLLARARTLPGDDVATWDLPADPAVVSRARSLACRQLAAWGAEDATPLTELIVSELVTNAIRYGRAPITLRLIHDEDLLCEVSDASSTSPHVRHAADTDEGGRGLFMVAQLADAWGTRYSHTGKTIWAQQALAASDESPPSTD
ncbi:SpoIIE family protein phosphatase [Kitasatospora sp. NPDC048296]|uniref:SpoIIE family protein phosphatase n=1 Tax=Kitasatospora sp. NPDC048296 TaxID=3364048 RepID=UPI0037217155